MTRRRGRRGAGVSGPGNRSRANDGVSSKDSRISKSDSARASSGPAGLRFAIGGNFAGGLLFENFVPTSFLNDKDLIEKGWHHQSIKSRSMLVEDNSSKNWLVQHLDLINAVYDANLM